jgi:thiol-disulfide isomerase/thioredoxin
VYSELNQDNLSELVSSKDTVFVQFSAGWCGNCRLMKPKFKRMAEEHQTASFVMVDAEKFPNSRQLATVNNLPTFAAFKNGQLINQVQTNKVESLKTFVDEITSN